MLVGYMRASPLRATVRCWACSVTRSSPLTLLAKGDPREPRHTVSDVIDWTYSGNKLHLTQKPLSVLLPLLETFSAHGELVLDPFAGSGSTLIAARSLGRRYLGIEIDAGYHAIATRRLEREAPSPATVAGLVQHPVREGAVL